MHKGDLPLGHLAVQVEDVDGKPVMRVRSVHPHSGLKVTLTFPVNGADIGPFKERVVRSVLARHR